MAGQIISGGADSMPYFGTEDDGWTITFQVNIPDGYTRTDVQAKVYDVVSEALDDIEAADEEMERALGGEGE